MQGSVSFVMNLCICVLCRHHLRIIKGLFPVIIFLYLALGKLFGLYFVFIFWIYTLCLPWDSVHLLVPFNVSLTYPLVWLGIFLWGIRNSISYRGAIAWNSLTNKETTAKTLKDFKRCLRKFDTDKINFEPILAITNNRDTDYKYFW